MAETRLLLYCSSREIELYIYISCINLLVQHETYTIVRTVLVAHGVEGGQSKRRLAGRRYNSVRPSSPCTAALQLLARRYLLVGTGLLCTQ